MTVRDKLNLIKKTQIYRLVFDDEIKGFRLSMYNDATEQLEYYDFIIEMVHDKDIQTYLLEHLNELPIIKCIDNGKGYLTTVNEQNNKISVQEFLDDEQVIDYTKRAISIIEEAKKCTK